MKRYVFFLLTLLLLARAFSVSASAGELPGSSQRGSVTVRLNYAEGRENLGSLTLYRVGTVREENGNHTFVPWGVFSEKWEGYENVQSADLARELAEYAAGGRAKGCTEPVRAEGTVTFSDLEPGLYLVTQQRAADGYEAICPFLVGVPNNEDGVYVYQVDASPKVQLETVPAVPDLPQTGQLNWPVPLLAVIGLGLFAAGLGLRRKNSGQ